MLYTFLDEYFLLTFLCVLKTAVSTTQVFSIVVGFVRPYYSPCTQVLVLAASLLVYVQVLLNFFRIRRTDPGRPPLSDGAHPACSKCGRVRVERAHHCRKCKQCTLQMDHHCCEG